MRTSILAVGRKGPFDDQISDYLSRAGKTWRSVGVTGPELRVVEAPKAMAGAIRQAREAELLEGIMPDGARAVLLDEGGKDATSREIAGLIARERAQGTAGLAFVIGGADGFDAAFAQVLGSRRTATLAFGRATWPHMLARLMLAEQLYRAATILTNHPYHRD